jgi:hypothetical protein
MEFSNLKRAVCILYLVLRRQTISFNVFNIPQIQSAVHSDVDVEIVLIIIEHRKQLVISI